MLVSIQIISISLTKGCPRTRKLISLTWPCKSEFDTRLQDLILSLRTTIRHGNGLSSTDQVQSSWKWTAAMHCKNANPRSPPRNIAASKHTTVRSALLITTTAVSNLLERRAKRCGVHLRPPLTTLETTYAERRFHPPLAYPRHRAPRAVHRHAN